MVGRGRKGLLELRLRRAATYAAVVAAVFSAISVWLSWRNIEQQRKFREREEVARQLKAIQMIGYEVAVNTQLLGQIVADAARYKSGLLHAHGKLQFSNYQVVLVEFFAAASTGTCTDAISFFYAVETAQGIMDRKMALEYVPPQMGNQEMARLWEDKQRDLGKAFFENCERAFGLSGALLRQLEGLEAKLKANLRGN